MATIKALSLVLTEIGMFSTQRQAMAAIGKGEITVEGLRVANKDALLVITSDLTIEHKRGIMINRMTIDEDGKRIT